MYVGNLKRKGENPVSVGKDGIIFQLLIEI